MKAYPFSDGHNDATNERLCWGGGYWWGEIETRPAFQASSGAPTSSAQDRAAFRKGVPA